jgi:protein-disulfide isomerase
MMEAAKTIPGLNIERFGSCIDNHEKLQRVLNDVSLGHELGVVGTPTLFINGMKAPQQTLLNTEALSAYLENVMPMNR